MFLAWYPRVYATLYHHQRRTLNSITHYHGWDASGDSIGLRAGNVPPPSFSRKLLWYGGLAIDKPKCFRGTTLCIMVPCTINHHRRRLL